MRSLAVPAGGSAPSCLECVCSLDVYDGCGQALATAEELLQALAKKQPKLEDDPLDEVICPGRSGFMV